MCDEMRDAWQRVKADDSVNAVVLRASGDKAFCAGLDIKKSYGQPDDVWNHEDPGELLSPKWQKVWKPVVCAVHGMCTAGAFYFVNESDVVICSTDATFFDSHVTYGMVSALEPVGLMRRVGLGETLRIALSGNDERVTAPTALRIGLVTEVVERDELWARAHEIAAGIARKPTAATQGTVRAIWESLDRPYRAAMEQGLLYTRLGNPIGMAEVAETPARATEAEDALVPDAARAAGTEQAHRAGRRDRSRGAGARVRAAVAHVGRARRDRRRGRRARRRARARASACSCATGRRRSASCSACSAPAGASSRSIPNAASSARAPTSPRSNLPVIAGGLDDLDALVGADSAINDARRRRPRRTARRDRAAPRARPTLARAGCRGADAHERHDRSAEADRPHLRHARARARRRQALRIQSATPKCSSARGVAIVNSPLVHLGGLFRVLQCVNDGRSLHAARAVRPRLVARRRAPPPAEDREPRAGRAAHGARSRRRSRRPRQRPVGDLRHRAALPRRRRRVHRRSTASRCS